MRKKKFTFLLLIFLFQFNNYLSADTRPRVDLPTSGRQYQAFKLPISKSSAYSVTDVRVTGFGLRVENYSGSSVDIRYIHSGNINATISIDWREPIFANGVLLYYKKGTETYTANTSISPVSPPVSGISGPSSLGAGSSVNFTSTYLYYSLAFNCSWDITPRTGVSFYGQNNSRFEVQFDQMGEYLISCRVTDLYNGLSSTVSKQITIDAGMVIIQSLSSLNNFDFKFENTSEELNERVSYQVFNQGSGEMVKNGNINIEGGNIDLGNCKKGIYVVRFDFGNNINKTHKIVVK